MFSINPAYDYQKGEYGIGEVEKRASLYRDCQRHGVGISVMKPFAGGQLLNAGISPFGQALTPVSVPAIRARPPGRCSPCCPACAGWTTSRTRSASSDAPPERARLCRHQPVRPGRARRAAASTATTACPVPTSLNIGLINKYYDLACAGDKLAEQHYARPPPPRRRLPALRPLRAPLPLPRQADGAHGRDRRALWILSVKTESGRRGTCSPSARALTKPTTAKIAPIKKKSEAIFASCVSCTCILRSLTSM